MKRKAGMRRSSRNQQSSRGQALIEFALILPLLFLLIVNVINFGGFLYAWVVVSNAARTGAQYLSMGSAMVHSPTSPSAAQVRTLVANDLSALPNRASAQVCVSQQQQRHGALQFRHGAGRRSSPDGHTGGHPCNHVPGRRGRCDLHVPAVHSVMGFQRAWHTCHSAADDHPSASQDEDIAMRSKRRKQARRGSTIVEFALVTLLLMVVLFAGIEFDRMILVYTTVADCAKVGVRYAIVHGDNRTGTGDPESGPGDNPDPVSTVIRNFASSGMLNVAALEGELR